MFVQQGRAWKMDCMAPASFAHSHACRPRTQADLRLRGFVLGPRIERDEQLRSGDAIFWQRQDPQQQVALGGHAAASAMMAIPPPIITRKRHANQNESRRVT
jgi:hypothetical protein